MVAPLAVRAADAKANWTNNCVQCHGAAGKGDTKMGKMLNAADLTDRRSRHRSPMRKRPRQSKTVLSRTAMKAFGGKLSDDEIKALVAYVRTLKK
jgi:mono/diheme cytochrome c family protein